MIKRWITAYRNMSSAVKAGLWFTFCNFLQKGISMISLPIFTRLLTMEEYGQLTIYQSWHTILSIFVTLNLSGSVINNGMLKYEHKRSEFISAIQGLATAVTLAFLAVYLLFCNFWNKLFDLTTPLMLIMFVQFLFEPAYLIWLQKTRFEFQYKKAVFVTVLVAVASPLLGIALVQLAQNRVLARVFAYAAVQIGVGMVLYIVQGLKGRKAFSKEYWKFALLFNLPLVPHYLSQHVLGQADRIMISRMVGDQAAAVYGVSYTLATASTLLVNAINSSFIPTMYQSIKERRFSAIFKSSSVLCGIMAAVVCLIMLAAPELIVVLAGKEYADAVRAIPPVAASIFFTFLYTLFINVEFYYEKTKYTMVVSVIGAVANLILNYLLIPAFGYVAAGYTTLFCFVMFAVGHYLLSVKLLRNAKVSEAIFDVRLLLLLSVAVLIFTALINVLYVLPVIRIGLLVCGLVAAIAKKEILLGAAMGK